jgi:hypothetical protein
VLFALGPSDEQTTTSAYYSFEWRSGIKAFAIVRETLYPYLWI